MNESRRLVFLRNSCLSVGWHCSYFSEVVDTDHVTLSTSCPRYPLYWRLGWPHSRSNLSWRENVFLPSGIKPIFLGRLICSLLPILSELSRSALFRRHTWDSRSGFFSQGKVPPYRLDRKLGGPQWWSWDWSKCVAFSLSYPGPLCSVFMRELHAFSTSTQEDEARRSAALPPGGGESRDRYTLPCHSQLLCSFWTATNHKVFEKIAQK
jgi:hypothetical protein